MSTQEKSLLFTELSLGHLRLANRLALLPLTTRLERDDEISDEYVRFFETRAKGGVGLIITGNLSLVPSRGQRNGAPGIFSDRFLPGLGTLVHAVHGAGVPILAQLGLMHHWQATEDSPVELVAPSPIPIHHEMPRALSVGEVEALVDQFTKAVLRAREAGFDGVELLACQGSLINRFLSPVTNQRTDRYGGSFENRIRLFLEILSNCKELAGEQFVIGARLSLDELIEGGMTPAQYLPICAALEQGGMNFLDVEVGWHESHIPHLQNVVTPGSLTYVAKAAKTAVTIPIITGQRINSVALAESILERGDADIIGMGRALIADPDLPNKARQGKLQDIRPCICCMRCNEAVHETQICCSVNPEAGYEGKRSVNKAAESKRVLIIGGGPAGMEAALIAHRRGHYVELIEKSLVLGGQLREASMPPKKTEIADFSAYLIRQIRNEGIRVQLGPTGDSATVLAMKPDVVILASGSHPSRPPIPGVNSKNVVSAVDAIRDPSCCKDTVVIVGGGLIGCETALTLAQAGHKGITVLEMLPRVGSDLGPMTRWVMLQELKSAGITLSPETIVERIELAEVIAMHRGERKVFPADTVIIATGMSPTRQLADDLRSTGIDFLAIGDCVQPKRILEAIESGYLAACEQ